jgi:hypothetical protein
MKKINLFLIVLVTGFFTSCFPDDYQTKAAKKVIDSLGAKEGEIEIEKGFDSDSGSSNVLTFSLNGVPDSIKSIGMDNLSFWVAKTFMRELPQEGREGIDKLRIVIDNKDTIFNMSLLNSQ